MKYDIFISYSRKDGAIVQSVADRLKAEGYACWMDVNGIESGDVFKRVLVQAIKESKIVVFFSSANSNNTEWTVKEINIAVQLKKPIIPVLLDDTSYDDSIMFDLSGLDYIPYQKNSIRDIGLGKLLRGVAVKCGKRQRSAVQIADPRVRPSKKSHFLVTILCTIATLMLLAIVAGVAWLLTIRKEHYIFPLDIGDGNGRKQDVIHQVDPDNKYGFATWPIDWNVDEVEDKLKTLKEELDTLQAIQKELETIEGTEK